MGRVNTIRSIPCRSAGYSHIIATPSYAIVTNVCVNTKDEFITLHLKNEKTLSNLLSKYDRKDFYCSFSFLLSCSQHGPSPQNPSQPHQNGLFPAPSCRSPSLLALPPLPVSGRFFAPFLHRSSSRPVSSTRPASSPRRTKRRPLLTDLLSSPLHALSLPRDDAAEASVSERRIVPSAEECL